MEAAPKNISTARRSKIYALAHELGMSTKSKEKDDDLHLLLDGLVGKPSMTLLTDDEADKIIAELEHRQRFGIRQAAAAEKPGGVSSGQQQKIIALMCELRKLDTVPSTATIEQRVAGIIRYSLHITASSKEPYKWLTYQHGWKLIETIKGLLNTARQQSEARSETG